MRLPVGSKLLFVTDTSALASLPALISLWSTLASVITGFETESAIVVTSFDSVFISSSITFES